MWCWRVVSSQQSKCWSKYVFHTNVNLRLVRVSGSNSRVAKVESFRVSESDSPINNESTAPASFVATLGSRVVLGRYCARPGRLIDPLSVSCLVRYRPLSDGVGHRDAVDDCDGYAGCAEQCAQYSKVRWIRGRSLRFGRDVVSCQYAYLGALSERGQSHDLVERRLIDRRALTSRED